MTDRSHRKGNTAIELTSLLDVIFIVLMIVICNQQINLQEKTETVQAAYEQAVEAGEEAEAMRAEAQQVLEEAQDARAEAEAERLLLEEHREKMTAISEQMTMVTVRIDYQPSNLKSRTIRLIVDEEVPQTVAITPETENQAFSQLEDTLEGIVSQAEQQNRPVVIGIDLTKILYRDELRAEEVLTAVNERHGNLYYRKSGRNE